MDEDEFRAVYQQINQQRCVFEKALLQQGCSCHHQQRFLLATREGVACKVNTSLSRCHEFLSTLREAARFALREVTISGPLPHNKELKVQVGGCIALQALVAEADSTPVDIDNILSIGVAHYGSVATLPYSVLVRGVVHYESRRRSSRR